MVGPETQDELDAMCAELDDLKQEAASFVTTAVRTALVGVYERVPKSVLVLRDFQNELRSFALDLTGTDGGGGSVNLEDLLRSGGWKGGRVLSLLLERIVLLHASVASALEIPGSGSRSMMGIIGDVCVVCARQMYRSPAVMVFSADRAERVYAFLAPHVADAIDAAFPDFYADESEGSTEEEAEEVEVYEGSDGSEEVEETGEEAVDVEVDEDVAEPGEAAEEVEEVEEEEEDEEEEEEEEVESDSESEGAVGVEVTKHDVGDDMMSVDHGIDEITNGVKEIDIVLDRKGVGLDVVGGKRAKGVPDDGTEEVDEDGDDGYTKLVTIIRGDKKGPTSGPGPTSGSGPGPTSGVTVMKSSNVKAHDARVRKLKEKIKFYRTDTFF